MPIASELETRGWGCTRRKTIQGKTLIDCYSKKTGGGVILFEDGYAIKIKPIRFRRR